MSEREYKPNKLGRKYAVPMTREDGEVIEFLKSHFMFAAMSWDDSIRADRADADRMFCEVDSSNKRRSETSAEEKEQKQNRGGGC